MAWKQEINAWITFKVEEEVCEYIQLDSEPTTNLDASCKLSFDKANLKQDHIQAFHWFQLEHHSHQKQSSLHKYSHLIRVVSMVV